MDKRSLITGWLRAGVAAVDPESLTRAAVSEQREPATLLAIGKAASAMCRGAAAALGQVDGLCITSNEAVVPDGVELLIGDHPLPGAASLAAGHRALEMAPDADLALISGGGSSLCEVPADGLTIVDVARVHRALLAAGANIADTNLVRAHLSRVKGGGLGPIPTYVLSDVAGHGPEVVSSGPTIGMAHDPDRARAILEAAGVDISHQIKRVLRQSRKRSATGPTVEVIGDGRTAARAVSAAAGPATSSRVHDAWIEDDYLPCLTDFIMQAPAGVTVAAGEPSVPAGGTGRGGRNTHTALTAALLIADSDLWFAALATDGVDGNAGAAGAIVDGTTLARGGDPGGALANCDSATYLELTGDLIETGPTGTNVADLWLIWKPEDRAGSRVIT